MPGTLWMHTVALALVLASLVPILDNGAVVSADEGAVLAQVELLTTTGGWSMPNPDARIDPQGQWFGIDISDRSGDRYFPYAKHATYPAAVRPLYDLGGQRLVIAASALGTLLTALFAALLARRVRPGPGFDVVTLWTVGIVSPIFFDSFWVIAHSIGAAFATGALLAAVTTIADRRARWLAPLAVGVAGAVLFRSEGMLYGLALAGGCGFVAIRRTGLDLLALVAGAVSGVTAAVCWWVDSRIYSSILGAPADPFLIKGTKSSWLADRIEGVWSSVLRPQLLSPTLAGSIFLAIAVLAVVGGLYLRFRPQERGLIRIVAAIAAVGALVTLALPKAPVPGLLVACPLLVVALLQVRWRVTTPPRLVLVSGGLFAAAIVATQYPVGGSMEWGGRFFHLALPGLVPVALAALATAAERLDRTTIRLGVGSLGVVSAVLVVMAVGSIVRIHGITADLVDDIVEMSEATASADDPGGPVVVSNMEAVGRLSWRGAVHGRYFRVTEPEDISEVAANLADAGVEEFVFAAPFHQDRDRAALEGYEAVRPLTRKVGLWHLYVMRRTGVRPGRD